MIRSRRLGVAGLSACAIFLTACSGGGGGGTAGEAAGGQATATKFSVLTNSENTTVPAILKSLSTGPCADENAALPLAIDTTPQTNLDQQLQLLAGQNALPVLFAAGNSPAFTKELFKGGQVADVGAYLEKQGISDSVLAGARSTVEAQYGGTMLALPFEYNIEGIFYNKALFEEQGVTVPTTWSELVAAADTFDAAGVQPFSASGEQGWPLTRLLGDYLFRKLGPDAMAKIADGSAKLTDDDYVDAAAQVADLGAKGYFGEGVGSIDYDTSFNTFLSGKAAMFYMGSWALSNFADTEQDKIGEENIGFMPFPSVEGGAGNIDQFPSNVGLPYTLSARSTDDPKVAAWMKCIGQNFGDAAQKTGTISGFEAANPTQASAEVAQTVGDTITGSTSSVLWFEALFDAKATTLSQTNAAPLVTGATSPADFMATVQAGMGS